MMLLIYILIGVVLGAFFSYALDMKTDTGPAIAIAGLGGLVGGLLLHIILPFCGMLFGIVGAVLGALLLLWLVSLIAR